MDLETYVKKLWKLNVNLCKSCVKKQTKKNKGGEKT